MRLEINVERKQFTVSRAPEPRTDAAGRQRKDKATDAPQWQVQLVAMDETGAEVIRVTVAGAPPEVVPGQQVQVVGLVAFPWQQDGRSGVAFRAESIQPVKARAA
jgi:hypothetical protein